MFWTPSGVRAGGTPPSRALTLTLHAPHTAGLPHTPDLLLSTTHVGLVHGPLPLLLSFLSPSSCCSYIKWQSRVMYFHFKKQKAAPGGEHMGGFTRLLHTGVPDDLMLEIPTFVVDPLPPHMQTVRGGERGERGKGGGGEEGGKQARERVSA